MDVWVLGRIGYDLYAVEHDIPLPEAKTFTRHLGGSSANIAVGLARLGVEVGIISAVGDDLMADYLLGFLKSENVDTRFVRRVAGYGTSLCLTEISKAHGFRQVFYRHRPADSQVVFGREEAAAIGGARMFITNGTSLQEGRSRDATTRALTAAAQGGMQTVLDVDYRPSSWNSPQEAGAAARGVLGNVRIVIANETEMDLLTATGTTAERAMAVLDAGPNIVVCKLGGKGVVAHTRERAEFVPPQPVEVVSTIGAGDGFASGFLYGVLSGRTLTDSLQLGNAAAAVVVSRVGCSDAMPYLYELEAPSRGATAKSG
ncbi:MAG TPA: 5-dehydro-2-deoxygluconokinase [Terriglobales bacterium]|nr:5-dehydro-2-deoxygluconokinase [Terriglobales bacterium]